MKHSGIMLVAGFCLAMAGSALAQGMEAIKQQMLDRKPAVEQLLDAKKAGENKAGFLEAVGSLTDGEAKTVAAENADRKTVYAAIAAKSGTQAAKVAALRAAEIAAKAKPGTKLQGRDGTWTEKQ
jgi:uncharacterized protein YdbL (DUF1318 family)